MKSDPETRFLSKIVINPETDCWEWQLRLGQTGYGYFKIDGKPVFAHRWSYTHFVGQIQEGLQIDHLCRVRHCVNPQHLEPVTGRVNKLRGFTVNSANAEKTHCLNGHEFNAANTYTSPQGKRDCRICHLARKKARKLRAMAVALNPA